MFLNPSRINEFQIKNHFDSLEVKQSEFLFALIMKHLHLESGSSKTKLKNMNTKPKKRLSIAELKSYPGFENYTDEMAEELLRVLRRYQFCFTDIIKNQFKRRGD